MRLVSWKKITKTKNERGLGLQAAKKKNTALLAKLCWRFHQERDFLWVHVLSHKHLNRRRKLQSKSRIYSTTWSALLGEEVIKNGIKWIASKNSCLSLWFDKWMSKRPLRSLIVGPRNRGEKALLLKDFIQHNHWDWESISSVIPPNLLLKIKATPTPLFADGKDRIFWAFSPSGEFELKEAYRLACSQAKILPKLAPLWEVGFGKLPLYPKSSAFFGNVFIEAVLEPHWDQGGLCPPKFFFKNSDIDVNPS
uniref:Uncharacterized protein n=1 Tax=Quercus lobata TaxID=97700 RepID=A0A7N2M2K5_QUELO